MAERLAVKYLTSVTKNLTGIYKQIYKEVSAANGKCAFGTDDQDDHRKKEQLFKRMFTLLVIERVGVDLLKKDWILNLQNIDNTNIHFELGVHLELYEIVDILIKNQPLKQLQVRFLRMFNERKDLIKQIILLKFSSINKSIQTIYGTVREISLAFKADIMASKVALPITSLSSRPGMANTSSITPVLADQIRGLNGLYSVAMRAPYATMSHDNQSSNCSTRTSPGIAAAPCVSTTSSSLSTTVSPSFMIRPSVGQDIPNATTVSTWNIPTSVQLSAPGTAIHMLNSNRIVEPPNYCNWPTISHASDVLEKQPSNPVQSNPLQRRLVALDPETQQTFGTHGSAAGKPTQKVQPSRKRTIEELHNASAPQCKRNTISRHNMHQSHLNDLTQQRVNHPSMEGSSGTSTASNHVPVPHDLQEILDIIKARIKPNQLEKREYLDTEIWRVCYTCRACGLFLNQEDPHSWPNHEVFTFHYRRNPYTCLTCSAAFHVTEHFIHHMRNGHPTQELQPHIPGAQQRPRLPVHDRQPPTQIVPSNRVLQHGPVYQAPVLRHMLNSSDVRRHPVCQTQQFTNRENLPYQHIRQTFQQNPSIAVNTNLPSQTTGLVNHTNQQHFSINTNVNLHQPHSATSTAMPSQTNMQHSSTISQRNPHLASSGASTNQNLQSITANESSQSNRTTTSTTDIVAYTPVCNSIDSLENMNPHQEPIRTLVSDSRLEHRMTSFIDAPQQDNSDLMTPVPGPDLIDFSRVVNIEPIPETDVVPNIDDIRQPVDTGNADQRQSEVNIKTEETGKRKRFEIHIDLCEDSQERLNTVNADIPTSRSPVQTEQDAVDETASPCTGTESSTPTEEAVVKDEPINTGLPHLIPLLVDLTENSLSTGTQSSLVTTESENLPSLAANSSTCTQSPTSTSPTSVTSAVNESDKSEEAPLDLRIPTPPSAPLDLSASSHSSSTTSDVPIKSELQCTNDLSKACNETTEVDKFRALWMKMSLDTSTVERPYRTPSPPVLSPAVSPTERKVTPKRLSFSPPLLNVMTHSVMPAATSTGSTAVYSLEEDDILASFVLNDVKNNNVNICNLTKSVVSASPTLEDVQSKQGAEAILPTDSSKVFSSPVLKASPSCNRADGTNPPHSEDLPTSDSSKVGADGTNRSQSDAIRTSETNKIKTSHSTPDIVEDDLTYICVDDDEEDEVVRKGTPDSGRYTNDSVSVTSPVSECTVEAPETPKSAHVPRASSGVVLKCCCPKPRKIPTDIFIVLSDDEDDDEGNCEETTLNEFSVDEGETGDVSNVDEADSETGNGSNVDEADSETGDGSNVDEADSETGDGSFVDENNCEETCNEFSMSPDVIPWD